MLFSRTFCMPPLSVDQTAVEWPLQAFSLALKINSYHISCIRDCTRRLGNVYINSRGALKILFPLIRDTVIFLCTTNQLPIYLFVNLLRRLARVKINVVCILLNLPWPISKGSKHKLPKTWMNSNNKQTFLEHSINKKLSTLDCEQSLSFPVCA